MKRNIDGILLLDKSLEISSNKALQQIKHLYAAKKAGHTGSLDPLASGMLPICLGEATKFSQYLLDADKHYSVTAQLGIKTTTGDAEGEIISQKPVNNFSQEFIVNILAQFIGEISQIPPMHSAIKINGQPLYQLARKGKTIDRASRTVQIYKIDLIEFNKDQFTLNVYCSKGTYIRTLIEDIGEKLGCGAHVTFLRRTGIAYFQAEQMITFQQLQEVFQQENYAAIDKYLLPINAMLNEYPILSISEEMAFKLYRGQEIAINENVSPGQIMQLIINNKKFIGLGEIMPDNKLISKRLISEQNTIMASQTE